MGQHKLLTKHAKIPVYFTHPYGPLEELTDKNSNGPVRDYFPAGKDFSTMPKARVKEVQNQLNERTRMYLVIRYKKKYFKK